MASRVNITEADILDALSKAASGDGPTAAKTTLELCAATKLSPLRMKKALRVLNEAGLLTPHRVMRRAIDGLMRAVPAYTIKPKQ